MPTTLEKSIISTLVYFDLFKFPLTKEELFKYLWKPLPISYSEFVEHLDSIRGLQSMSGFYFLPGRAEIVRNRQQAVPYLEFKLKRAQKAAKLIRAVPFLRAVFVSNSVAAETPSKNSDIDLFVVAAAGRVWLVRLWTNIILRLFGLRVYGQNRKDRVCLCFFVDENNLDLINQQAMPEDIHFAYWLKRMLPIYDPNNIFSKFIKQNVWVNYLLPNAGASYQPYLNSINKETVGGVWKKFWEVMWRGSYGNIVEKEAKGLQWLKMKRVFASMAKEKSKDVVIGDGIIKLHLNDTRKMYKARWQQKIQLINYVY